MSRGAGHHNERIESKRARGLLHGYLKSRCHCSRSDSRNSPPPLAKKDQNRRKPASVASPSCQVTPSRNCGLTLTWSSALSNIASISPEDMRSKIDEG